MSGKAKLAAATVAALVMASGVHHKHHHWSMGAPSLLAAHAVSVPPNANAALGQRLAAREYGWTGGQWDCLNHLWQGESGWSNTADTRASGLDPANASVFAYGIPQSRPATKMPRSAWPPDLGGRANARTQIKWGLGYIDHTYGSPCAALSFKQSTGNQGY